MNGRVYDPTIGRFMSADPFIQAPTDTQSYNRYSYVRNNPVNLTDPSGYNWLEKAADMVVGAALMTVGVSFVIAPEPTGLTKFVASVLISTGGGLLSGNMQLFNKDENGNRYFAIQGQIPTNWGQGTDSLTSHQSNMIASQTSDEAFYNHDITYNYKYMNAGASESFSYNGDSSGSIALYGDGWNSNGDFSIYGAEDKLVITNYITPLYVLNADAIASFGDQSIDYDFPGLGIFGAGAKGAGLAVGAMGIGAKVGRLGKQKRLKELMYDLKISSRDRGWIKQEINQINRGKRSNIRVPIGKNLAHRRGYEAKKGYGYSYSDLQDIDLHKLQHRFEGY